MMFSKKIVLIFFCLNSLFYNNVCRATFNYFQNNSVVLQTLPGPVTYIVTTGVVNVNGENQIFVARYTMSGLLDSSFGTSGYTITQIGTSAQATGVAVDSSNNILVSGYAIVGGITKFIVARYTSSGVLDTTFGPGSAGYNAITAGGDGAQAQAIQVDTSDRPVLVGTVVMGGVPQLLVARFTTSGDLDTSNFGNPNGYVTQLVGSSSYGFAVVIASDGKIVVGGQGDVSGVGSFSIWRFATNGTLDTAGFNAPNGYVTATFGVDSQINGIAIQTDTKILVAGNTGDDIALARYSTSGVLDISYDSDGLVILTIGDENVASNIKLQSDDKAIVVGAVDDKFMIARITTAGALDTTFNSTGYNTVRSRENSQGNAVVEQPDTNIVVSGWAAKDAAVARFDSTGAFDTTFGNRGVELAPAADTDGPLEGHLWSFDTTTQNVTTINTLQDITFNTNVFLDEWSHTAGTAIFTCNNSGLYLVTYELQININALVASTASAVALINGSEVNGSQAALGLGLLSGQTVQLSRNFIIEVNAGDQLKIQFTGSSTSNRLLANLGSGSLSKPSASLTAFRIFG